MFKMGGGERYTRVQCAYSLRDLERSYNDEGSKLTFVAGGRTERRANIPAECDFGVFDVPDALEEPNFEIEVEQTE